LKTSVTTFVFAHGDYFSKWQKKSVAYIIKSPPGVAKNNIVGCFSVSTFTFISIIAKSGLIILWIIATSVASLHHKIGKEKIKEIFFFPFFFFSKF
jgi:uncharacterized membrane protein